MQVSVMTNKTSRILLMLLYYLIQRESQRIVLMWLWHHHWSRNQVLGNHCVFSPTYWMLNQKHQNIVLELKNINIEPLKWLLSSGPRRKKLKWHSKINENIKRNIFSWITRHPQVVQSPIYNCCLKVVFDDQTEPQLFPFFYFRCP